jgi:phage terminase small subunit
VGNKGKSLRLKLIEGDHTRGTGTPTRPELHEPASGCSKPSWLSGRAAEVWDFYVPQLLESGGLLSVLDHHMFAAFCICCVKVEEGSSHAEWVQQLRQLSAVFGLDPLSRSRVGGSPPRPEDPADH